MAVIGGFRSDVSITRKTDGKFFPWVFCFPKTEINYTRTEVIECAQEFANEQRPQNRGN